MSLDTDLDQREYWRAYLRERSLETLADRFGVSTTAVWLSEIRALASLTDEENVEIKRLRDEYHTALRDEMPKYRLKSIAQRNGINIRRVALAQQKRLERRAAEFYQKRQEAA